MEPLPKGHEYLTSCAMIMPFFAEFGSWFQLTLTEVGAMVMAITFLRAPMGTEGKQFTKIHKHCQECFHLAKYFEMHLSEASIRNEFILPSFAQIAPVNLLVAYHNIFPPFTPPLPPKSLCAHSH